LWKISLAEKIKAMNKGKEGSTKQKERMNE
jgi:hypothetical protein